MSYNRPTLAALREQIASDIESDADGVDAHTRGHVPSAIANAQAGALHGLYGYHEWIEKQIFDDTASDENIIRRAAEFSIFRIAGNKATGSITISGTGGAVIPAGSVLLSKKTGVQYSTNAEATLVDSGGDGIATVSITAMATGSIGNLATELTFIDTPTGVDTLAPVVSLSAGSDIESISRLRQRLRERRSQPPAGGNDNDYKAWAKASHVDVTRVWVFPKESGLGSVTVRFVTDDLATPIPTAAHIAAAETYMDDVRPAGMKSLIIEAPAQKTINISISQLSPNTQAVRDSVTAELEDFFSRSAGVGETIYRSKLDEAVSLAPGEQSHVITSPSENITVADTEFPVLGSITFQ